MIRSSAYPLFQRILRADKLPSACPGQRLFGCARVNIPSPFFNTDGDGGGQACSDSYCPIAAGQNSSLQWVYHPGAVAVARAVVGVVGGALAAAIPIFIFGGMGGVCCGPLPLVAFIAVAPVPPDITSVVPNAYLGVVVATPIPPPCVPIHCCCFGGEVLFSMQWGGSDLVGGDGGAGAVDEIGVLFFLRSATNGAPVVCLDACFDAIVRHGGDFILQS